MEYFDLKSTKVSHAIVLNRVFPVSAVNKIVFSGFLLMLAFGGLWLVDPKFLGDDRTLGFFLLTASATYVFWVYSLFFETYLDYAEIPAQGEENLANYLDYDSASAFSRYFDSGAGDFALLALELVESPGAQFALYRLGVSPQEFKNSLKDYLKIHRLPLNQQEIENLLKDAIEEKNKTGTGRILTWRDVFLALCAHSEFIKKFIFDLHLEKSDVKRVLDWQAEVEEAKKSRREFWSYENLMRSRGVGKDWAAGFTINLDKYAVDVSRLVSTRGFSPHLYGRTEETEAVERILARDGQNNVVLVGDEGVGRKTTVFALAERITLGRTLAQLAHKRVLRLDVAAILAGGSGVEDTVARFKIVLNEAVKAGNVILLIEEIHSLFDDSGAAGTINATEILLPYLTSSYFQVIGLTTYKGYHDTIARNSSLSRVFEKVELKEPAKPQVYEILHDVVPQIEAHSHVLILYQAIKAAIDLTDRYVKNVPFPEKAIDVLQEAAVYAKTKVRSSAVRATHVEEVVRRKTDIPVGQMALAEKDVLLNLESALHSKVIGQEEAIRAISNAMRRARSGISSEKKPIGSFLFLGPTGVGKTETAKALAAVYFGSEKHMVRLDMSEYQQADSIHRLIGHDEDPGFLTVKITDNPFSLLLLDEIEKANSNILNLFLQVLDDGRLTDALGRTVDFTNTIIIATSNAGAEMIRESILQFKEANLKERLLDHLQKQGIFKPEFLNRFDAVVIYKPLTGEQTQEVVGLLISDLNRRLKEKDVSVVATPELIKKIAELGYDPQFGARPLRRVIQDKVENVVARKLLSGEIKRGDQVPISPEELL